MFNTPIMKAAFPTAEDTNRVKRARERLESQVRTGSERQKRLVEMVSKMHIKDALVDPNTMDYHYGKALSVKLSDGNWYGIHPHALGQMAQIFEYPKLYLNKLQKGVAGIALSECRNKLVNDMSWHAKNSRLKDRRGNAASYLVRSVDGEIRGYLSRSFKRHLASKPLMRAFLKSCEQAGLHPVDGHASPVRVNLQCSLPYVFEPYPGEFLAIGVSWSNSDFGGGRMKVSMSMKRINGEAAVVLNDAISEVHVGPVIEEADIEMSDETHKAELKAQSRAINDAVVGQLQPDKVKKMLAVVKAAHEEEIPWEKLRYELARHLQKKELQEVRELLDQNHEGYEELPPITYDDEDDPIPSRWWASSVLGSFAEREGSAERKKELQELAGSILGKVKVKKAS